MCDNRCDQEKIIMMCLIASCFCNMNYELMNLNVFSVTCSAFTPVPTYWWT